MLTQIFMYEGAQVRTVIIDDQPWLVAKDLCDILEIANPTQALSRLEDDERSMFNIGRQGEVNVVNEYGMYSLILGSRKTEAKAFKRWITHEVLPQIRKTGSYSTTPQQALPQSWAETLRLLADEMESKAIVVAENQQLTIETAEQKQKLKDQETPIAIYNLAIAAHNTMSMQEVAKSFDTGRTRLYNILREESIVMKGSTTPYQRYIDSGHFKVVERPRATGDTIQNDPATRVTAKVFDYIGKLLQKRAERNAQEKA